MDEEPAPESAPEPRNLETDLPFFLNMFRFALWYEIQEIDRPFFCTILVIILSGRIINTWILDFIAFGR